jgi:SPP1 gp7 family putative phage head morphogenesis protein
MALRKQYIRVINNVKRGGVEYAKSRISLELFNKEIGEAIKRIYLQAGLFMANRTLSQLRKIKVAKSGNKGADTLSSPLSFKEGGKKRTTAYPDSSGPASTSPAFPESIATHGPVGDYKDTINLKYKTFGFNPEWVAQILEYFQMYLLEKAVIGVSNTTRFRILETLAKATTEGWSNDKIIKELSDLVEIRNRARMIVRTETVRAVNYGVLLGSDKYEYETQKEWVAVLDNRVRHSHETVDGQKREMEERFSNGLLFPGDPDGTPENTINCRCSIVTVAKRDARGRLIPKQKVFA